jgi:hypothetical protein
MINPAQTGYPKFYTVDQGQAIIPPGRQIWLSAYVPDQCKWYVPMRCFHLEQQNPLFTLWPDDVIDLSVILCKRDFVPQLISLDDWLKELKSEMTIIEMHNTTGEKEKTPPVVEFKYGVRRGRMDAFNDFDYAGWYSGV